MWEKNAADITHPQSTRVLRPRYNKNNSLIIADDHATCVWTVWKLTGSDRQLNIFSVEDSTNPGACLFMRTRRRMNKTFLALKSGQLPCETPKKCDRRLFMFELDKNSNKQVLRHVKSNKFVTMSSRGNYPKLTKDPRKAQEWRVDCGGPATPIECKCTNDSTIVCSANKN